MSTTHCARTSFWWVCACVPHLWFVHLSNWHFSLHLPPLQRTGICAVDNFQRLRFDSLLTTSQESIKHKTTFTSTFRPPSRTNSFVPKKTRVPVGQPIRIRSPLVHNASFLIVKNSGVREEFSYHWFYFSHNCNKSLWKNILLVISHSCNSPLVCAPPQLPLFTSPNTPSTPRHVRGRQFPTLEIWQYSVTRQVHRKA